MIFGETKVVKEKSYAARKAINILDLNTNNMIILKTDEPKTNSKYLVEFLYKVVRLSVSKLTKMSEYAKAFKVKDGDKDKNIKLMSFRIYGKRLYNIKLFGIRFET